MTSTDSGSAPETGDRPFWYWVRLLVGGAGLVAALLVPFMPVLAKSTTVTWPKEGQAVESTMAFFVPYAPQRVHVGVVQAGRMRVMHDDGSVVEIGPGEAYVIEPGHDAEILGEERFVGFEFEPKAAEEYAR